LSSFAFGINNLENDLGISPKFSSPLGGRGFTLLDRKIYMSDVGIDEVLSNRVKVRGRGFLLFTSFEGNGSVMSDCLLRAWQNVLDFPYEMDL